MSLPEDSLAKIQFNLLQALEDEFEGETPEAELYGLSQLTYLTGFSKLGFDTTAEFRRRFSAIEKALMKRGKYWSIGLFEKDFCGAAHYIVHLSAGGKRFTVLRSFPVEYRLQPGRNPLLVNIAVGALRGNFVSMLQKKGQQVRVPHMPCSLRQISFGQQLLNKWVPHLRR